MKKKIVLRSGTLKMGGLERVLIEVLQGINLEKYEVHLFIQNDAGKENIFLKDVPQGIKVYFLKPEKLLRKAEFYRENRKNPFYRLMYIYTMMVEQNIIIKNTVKYLKEIEQSGEIDLFIDYDSGAAKYIEKLNMKKSLVWLHSSVVKLLKREDKIKRFGKRLEKYDGVVTICNEMKEEVKSIYPQIKDKVYMAYNPFNFERIKSLEEDESELTLEHREFMKESYCVAVSRLDSVQKDYPTLLKAFKILKDKGVKEKLYIIGQGEGKEEIEKEIVELGLERDVKLLGLMRNPYIWMKRADLFVHSSKYEGFGLVLIEAAYFGKVVISSNCPTGPTEILGDGEFGLLFNVGDYETLAEKIEMILKDEELKRALEKKAAIRAMDFSRERVMVDYERIIDNI